MPSVTRAAVLFLLLPTSLLTPAVPRVPDVQPNDNRSPAGVLKNGELRLELVAQPARWAPEEADGPSIMLAALGEEGRAPQIPAPTIRVPQGTRLSVTIRNTLPDSTLYVYGLQPHPASANEPFAVPPGEQRSVTFDAGAPGTYLYGARPGKVNPDSAEREQMLGAFVVDAPGARTDDRIFVINIWGDPIDSLTYRNALAINGRSWPYTEPLTAVSGDTLHWRVLNGSVRNHPMHLHGFYYDVESRGDMRADTAYDVERQDRVVTEAMPAFSTMRLKWVAERPGNWLFHCHLAFHVIPETARLDPPAHDHAAHSADARKHMAGLVLGIAVAPGAKWREPRRTGARRMHLFVDEGRPRGKAARALGFVLQGDDALPAADSVVLPGSPLILRRGQPTDITVVNRLKETTAVHWHGIELESWSDGVAGWSGKRGSTAPAIAPGDSFVARLTLPRAGTFIYHTHMNDLEQITSGLYGAIVVLEPGQRYDPRTDHLFIAGWDGPEIPGTILINGAASDAPLVVSAGQAQRLRFVNIGPAARLRFEVRQDTAFAQWRPLAKDGADLPPARAIAGRARRAIAVGETFDAEFLPRTAGEFTLSVLNPEGKRVYERKIVAR